MKTAYDIIIRPIISEQSMEDIDIKKYVFEVDKRANKIEVGKAVAGRQLPHTGVLVHGRDVRHLHRVAQGLPVVVELGGIVGVAHPRDPRRDGIAIDDTKEVCRTCYLPSDPECYVNEKYLSNTLYKYEK